MLTDEQTAMSEQITQRDREAAARMMKTEGLICFRKYSDILAGLHDDNAIVQAFARHRRETLEEDAKIADQWRDENKASAAKARKRESFHGIAGYESPQLADQLDGAAIECNAIAAAIRNLK